jgi:hypothetical protein
MEPEILERAIVHCGYLRVERLRIRLTDGAYRTVNRTGPGGGVASEHEGIRVIERPLAVLADDADQGRIADAKLMILVLALRVRQPQLFASVP